MLIDMVPGRNNKPENLNTSNVNVNQNFLKCFDIVLTYLNTSNVNVNLHQQ